MILQSLHSGGVDDYRSQSLTKHFEKEVIANLEIHISCLRRQHMTLVRENLAHNGSSAVLNEISN